MSATVRTSHNVGFPTRRGKIAVSKMLVLAYLVVTSEGFSFGISASSLTCGTPHLVCDIPGSLSKVADVIEFASAGFFFFVVPPSLHDFFGNHIVTVHGTTVSCQILTILVSLTVFKHALVGHLVGPALGRRGNVGIPSQQTGFLVVLLMIGPATSVVCRQPCSTRGSSRSRRWTRLQSLVQGVTGTTGCRRRWWWWCRCSTEDVAFTAFATFPGASGSISAFGFFLDSRTPFCKTLFLLLVPFAVGCLGTFILRLARASVGKLAQVTSTGLLFSALTNANKGVVFLRCHCHSRAEEQ